MGHGRGRQWEVSGLSEWKGAWAGNEHVGAREGRRGRRECGEGPGEEGKDREGEGRGLDGESLHASCARRMPPTLLLPIDM